MVVLLFVVSALTFTIHKSHFLYGAFVNTLISFFVIAAVALGLLLIGIHNAWDTVIYVVVDRGNIPTEPAKTPEEAAHANAKTG